MVNTIFKKLFFCKTIPLGIFIGQGAYLPLSPPHQNIKQLIFFLGQLKINKIFSTRIILFRGLFTRLYFKLYLENTMR